MTRPFNLSPDIEAVLERHREILPLPPSVEARALARAAAAATTSQHQQRRFRWLLAAAIASLAVLGAAAYAGYRWSVPLSARVPASALPGNLLSPRAVAPPVDNQAVTPPSTLAAPTATPSPARARGPSSKNAELSLLRPARDALSRGEFTGALSLTAEHARRFPNGSMVEEREALRVMGLAGLGRGQEAKRAANAFHARFPRSVLLSTFDRMTEQAP